MRKAGLEPRPPAVGARMRGCNICHRSNCVPVIALSDYVVQNLLRGPRPFMTNPFPRCRETGRRKGRPCGLDCGLDAAAALAC